MAGLLSGMFPHLFGGAQPNAPMPITPPGTGQLGNGNARPLTSLYGRIFGTPDTSPGAGTHGGFLGLNPNQQMLGMGMGLMGGQGWGQGLGQGFQNVSAIQQAQRQQQLMQLLHQRMLGMNAGPQPSPNTTLPGVY